MQRYLLPTKTFYTLAATVLRTLILSQLFFVPYQICNVDAKSTISSSASIGSSSLSTSKFGGLLIRQPESTVAPLSDVVLFECELNLAPDHVEWRFHPQNVSQNIQHFNDHNTEFIYLKNDDKYNISNDDCTSKLRVNVNQDSIGEYQCIAWFGAAALASLPAKLELANINLDSKYSQKTSENLNWRVSPGNTVLIHCGQVISNPTPAWIFYKNNRPLPSTVSQLPSGALVLSSVTLADSGTYTCSAVNSLTMAKIEIPHKTIINVEISTKTAPSLLFKPPTWVSAKPNTTAILECPGIGNPIPKAIWSRPDANIFNNRTTTLSYGLQIVNVRPDDRGTYVCLLDNGFTPQLIHTIQLEVQEPPVILFSHEDTITDEGHRLELECIAQGYPTPIIYWLINGKDTRHDKAVKANKTKLLIKTVEKRHAGIVQCFARNNVGEVYVSRLLEVNPKQISGEIGSSSALDELITHSTKSNFEQKWAKDEKKQKQLIMIPPSRPTATRLSDETVMVRWSVPEREGLPIQFFKIQYRSLGDGTNQLKRSHWMTPDVVIPPQARMYEVDNLKPGHYYRFRIAAVYSNNDNKLSNVSAKFLLQRGSQLDPIRSHLAAPNLTNVEPISETSIVLHWSLPKKPLTPVDGFYAYYRPASTAGEYSKVTVDGMHKNQFRIDNLEPGTAYEFKLQSFTKSAASQFLAIVTAKTLSKFFV